MPVLHARQSSSRRVFRSEKWSIAAPCRQMAGGCFYGREASEARLWRLDLANSMKNAAPLTLGTQLVWAPDVSPDGQWIAASMSGSESGPDMVKIPIVGGELVRLGEGGGRCLGARRGAPGLRLSRRRIEHASGSRERMVGRPKR